MMSTRILTLVVAWIAFTLSSCKEVAFPEPQPKGVKPIREIPASLQGRYVPITPDDKQDTLIIESWGYHFKDANNKDWLGRGVISDSLVIKFYKGYYFVNFRGDDLWFLRVIKQQPSGS